MSKDNGPATKKDVAKHSGLIIAVNFVIGAGILAALNRPELGTVFMVTALGFASMVMASQGNELLRKFWSLLGKEEWL